MIASTRGSSTQGCHRAQACRYGAAHVEHSTLTTALPRCPGTSAEAGRQGVYFLTCVGGCGNEIEPVCWFVRRCAIFVGVVGLSSHPWGCTRVLQGRDFLIRTTWNHALTILSQLDVPTNLDRYRGRSPGCLSGILSGAELYVCRHGVASPRSHPTRPESRPSTLDSTRVAY